MAHRFTLSTLRIFFFMSACFTMMSWTNPELNTPIFKTESGIVPPVFITSTPDDITVDCFDLVPSPVDLMANDGAGGAPFAVSPVDDPPGPIDACTGGVISRTWTATVGGESTTVEQIITVLADNTSPTVMMDTTPDTVACELAQLAAPNNALRFDTWQSSLIVAVSSNADDCAGVSMITNNSPDYPSDCGSVDYIFTLTDICGYIIIIAN